MVLDAAEEMHAPPHAHRGKRHSMRSIQPRTHVAMFFRKRPLTTAPRAGVWIV
jgi:hypothetical protein